MPRLSVMFRMLRDLRWQVFWYGIGLAVMAAFVVAIFPSYSEQLADFEIPEVLRGLIGEADFATGKGFITAEILSWFPIILVIFAIMGGTSAAAGEEASGTLDLVLAQPLSRSRFLIEKLAALLIATLVICGFVYVGWLASVPFVDIDVGLDELALATLNLVPLVAFFQAFALWAGVTFASRGLATGLVVAVAVGTYFINYLASIVEALEPLRWVSPFYHYHGTEVLTDGLNWGGVALLTGLYLAFAAWALISFQHRDLGVGDTSLRLRFWQRGAAAET